MGCTQQTRASLLGEMGTESKASSNLWLTNSDGFQILPPCRLLGMQHGLQAVFQCWSCAVLLGAEAGGSSWPGVCSTRCHCSAPPGVGNEVQKALIACEEVEGKILPILKFGSLNSEPCGR